MFYEHWNVFKQEVHLMMRLNQIVPNLHQQVLQLIFARLLIEFGQIDKR